MNKQLEYLITTHGRPAVLKVMGGQRNFQTIKSLFFIMIYRPTVICSKVIYMMHLTSNNLDEAF